MSEFRDYKFEIFSGPPPEGERDTFFGFDADNAPYIMRWNFEVGCWVAITLQPTPLRPTPFIVLCQEERANHIVSWARTPALWGDVCSGAPQP